MLPEIIMSLNQTPPAEAIDVAAGELEMYLKFCSLLLCVLL